MDVILSNNPDELFRTLSDRIEEIEHLLLDDEEFCNKDLDATYQTAVKYVQKLQNKFGKKLNELKTKIDRLREENRNVSKENNKRFEDQIEEINQLFSSGEHQQALETFHHYQTQFQQRITIIDKVPKLYLREIDINQYFTIGQPIISPQLSSDSNKENCLDRSKLPKIEDQKINQRESPKLGSISPQIPPNNQTIYEQRKLSAPIPSPRLFDISQRISTPTPIQNPSPSPSIYSQSSTSTTDKADRLWPEYVAPYQHESQTLLTMICDGKSIVLLRSQSERLQRWRSIVYERSKLDQPVSKWHNFVFKSLGFIDQNRIYIFTDREFLVYSTDFSSKLYSCILLNNQNYNSHCDNIHLGYGGTVYGNFIYHIYQNLDQHWILSVLTLDTIHHVADHNLSMLLPGLTRVIQLSINARLISFLVLIDNSQYAVMFCNHDSSTKIQLKKFIYLSYAENPRSICSIGHDIYLVNDPSAKVLHLLNSEKYLQSYSLTAHCLYYMEENNEIVFVANDGIYSISINEHLQFFSRFHRN